MRFSTVRRLAIPLAVLFGGSAQAANHCVDAKDRAQAIAACAGADKLPLAAPGTYSTLPERSPPTRGQQAKVYASNANPVPDLRTEGTRAGATQGAVPVVVELNAGPGAAGTGAVAPGSPGRPAKRKAALAKAS